MDDFKFKKSSSVCAIVVTFNRRVLLGDCLRALKNQTRCVDKILVVNNASTDGTSVMLQNDFPEIEVLNLTRNIGGAGGFHAGMKWAFENGFQWLWLMDDDGIPAPDCLGKLLARCTETNAEIAVPLQRDSDGRIYGFALWNKLERNITQQVQDGQEIGAAARVFHFVGPLLSRSVVERCGLPQSDFFIWFDDIEYALRAGQNGAQIEFVPDAVFAHDFGGKAKEANFLGRRTKRVQQPAWKEYYGARNYLYTLTRTRRETQDLLHFLVHVQGRGMIGDLMYEPDRWKRIRLRVRGLGHGALGWMGKRV